MAGFLFVDVVSSQGLNDNLHPQVARRLYAICDKARTNFTPRAGRRGGLRVTAGSAGDGILVSLEETRGTVNPGQVLLDLAFALQDGAKSLGKTLGLPSGVPLRIGIHHGTRYSVKDVNGQPDVSGIDVIAARRVMDVGDENHILCSAAAQQAFFQQLPASARSVEFHPLPYPYTDKRGQVLTIVNVVKRVQGRVVYGNAERPKVRLTPDMHLFPPAKSIGEFRRVRHLTIVGLTNDQIVKMLALGLAPPVDGDGKRARPTIEKLDVFYAAERNYDHLPEHEESLRYAGAVGGNPRRDRETCELERAGSMQTIRTLAARCPDVHVRLWEYPFPPAAAIVACDVDDPKRGVIEVTHYIWGWKLGSCPMAVWRAGPNVQGFELYREHLALLRQASTPLYDSRAAVRTRPRLRTARPPERRKRA